jgi:hypothetical protein
MKKITLRIMTVPVLALAVCAAACATDSRESRVASVIPGYLIRHIAFSAPLSARRNQEKPLLTLSLRLLEVTGPKHEAVFWYNLLYGGSDPDHYRDALVREYQSQYRQFPETGDAGFPPSAADWEHWETVELASLRERGLVLGREQYVYTGGAHGMQTKAYYVIDRETLRVLSLADFFREPEGAKLRDIVWEELRRYSNLAKDQPLSEGIFFVNEPEMSANFFINDQGLGLRWDPYEIAPYSEGGIEITIPWKTVRPLLKLEAMELLVTFGIYLFV